MVGMEKQRSFCERKSKGLMMLGMQKQQSFCERKSKDLMMAGMKKQQSFCERKSKDFMAGMEKQRSFCEKKSKVLMSKRGDSALHRAARGGNLEQVKSILQGSNDGSLKALLSLQNQDEETPMYAAAENGHASIVIELVKLSDFQTAAIKARNGYDSFHIAAKQGHVGDYCIHSNSFPKLVHVSRLLDI